MNKSLQLELSKKWTQWFIGFTEGDGCFVVTKVNNVTFEIYQKEKCILTHILQTLKFGNIYKHSLSGVYTYSVSRANDLKKIIELFNGNILTSKKQKQFERFLIAYNIKNSNSIPFICNDKVPTFTDSWLSGFIDAEGSFHVYFYKKSYRVDIRFKVGQKSDRKICKAIEKLFKGDKSASVQYYKKHDFYEFRLDSQKGVQLLFPYLDMFQLKTQKIQSYKRWKNVHRKLVYKKHLKDQTRQKLIVESEKINNFS